MKKDSFFQKDGVKTLLASLISILIGMLSGVVVIIIVGIFNESISAGGIWDGIRLVFLGIFNKARDAATGTLMFGFNPTYMGNMLFRAMPLGSRTVSRRNLRNAFPGAEHSYFFRSRVAGLADRLSRRHAGRSSVGMYSRAAEIPSEY